MLERSDLWEFFTWLCRGLGAIVSSAVYLGICGAYTIASHNHLAAKFVIAAAGVTFLGYLAQLAVVLSLPKESNPIWKAAQVLTWLSVALGAAAGILILAS